MAQWKIKRIVICAAKGYNLMQKAPKHCHSRPGSHSSAPKYSEHNWGVASPAAKHGRNLQIRGKDKKYGKSWKNQVFLFFVVFEIFPIFQAFVAGNVLYKRDNLSLFDFANVLEFSRDLSSSPRSDTLPQVGCGVGD